MAWCRTRGGWCCSSLHSSVWHSDRCISLKNCPAMPSRPDKTHINYPQLQSIYQWCGSSCRRWSSLPLQCTSTKSAGTATLVGPTSQSHGQCIEPPKNCATVYTWHPDKNGILQIAPSPPLPTPITLAENNAPTLININKMSDGVRYLGVYITRDRNTKPMEANLWKKALTYTAAFQRTLTNHHEVTILYRSCFVPALPTHYQQPGYLTASLTKSIVSPHQQFWTRWATTGTYHGALCLHQEIEAQWDSATSIMKWNCNS